MKNLLVLFFTLMIAQAEAQIPFDLGVEFQAYPTGIIVGGTLDFYFSSRESLFLKYGYNRFDHRDLGVQEEELGSGQGFTLGYARFFSDEGKGWRIAVKNDVWWSQVKWSNNTTNPNASFGISDIIVLQPTLQLEYAWLLDTVLLSPTISFGYEWNVKTEGMETGQGAIGLAGIRLVKRLP